MVFALNDQKLENIFRAIRLGMPKTRAAILGNVSHNAFARHEKRGKELLGKLEDGQIGSAELSIEDQLCVKLVLGMEKARSEGLNDRLQIINDAGSTEWRAAGWLVERTEPKYFGKRIFEENTVTQTSISLEGASVEEILALKKAIRDWEQAEFGGEGDDSSSDG